MFRLERRAFKFFPENAQKLPIFKNLPVNKKVMINLIIFKNLKMTFSVRLVLLQKLFLSHFSLLL